MSRTDKDSPEWVRAMHEHNDGHPTGVRHSWHCEEYDGTIWGPRDYVIRRVARKEAEAAGWPLAGEPWSNFNGSTHVYARVPHGPFPCDVDSAGSRCLRWTRRRNRWYYFAPPSRDELHNGYFDPERRAVRDACRDAVREYNSYGDVHDDGAGIPARQTRSSTWRGGWWD